MQGALRSVLDLDPAHDRAAANDQLLGRRERRGPALIDARAHERAHLDDDVPIARNQDLDPTHEGEDIYRGRVSHHRRTREIELDAAQYGGQIGALKRCGVSQLSARKDRKAVNVGVSGTVRTRTRHGAPHEGCADQYDERRPEDGPEIDPQPVLLGSERPESAEDERDPPKSVTLTTLQQDTRAGDRQEQRPGGLEEVSRVGPAQIVREQAQPERGYDESYDDDAERVRTAFEIARVFGLHDVHSSPVWRYRPGSATLRCAESAKKTLPANCGRQPVNTAPVAIRPSTCARRPPSCDGRVSSRTCSRPRL